MNKTLKYSIFCFAAASSMALSSCSSDDDIAKAESDSLGTFGNVYFPETSFTAELDPVDPTTYTVTLKREDATSAVTVPMVVEGADSIITATEASFAAGEDSTSVTLDFSKAEIGVTYSAFVKAANSMYMEPFEFTVTRVKWNDAGSYYDDNGAIVTGYAKYTDDLVTTFYGIDNTTQIVKLQERDDKPGYFRIINAYAGGYAYNEDGDYDADNDYYIYIDATDSTMVYIPEKCEQGTDWGYGNFIVWSMAGYYLAKGDDEAAKDYYGTYENGVITFPAEALLFGMADYNSGGMYTSNGNGAFRLEVKATKQAHVADITSDDFSWETAFDEGAFTSSILGNETTAALLKGVCVNTTDSCDKTFYQTYGTAYKIVSPYAEGYDIYFCVNADGEVTSPLGSQPTGLVAMGASVYAYINASASSFSEKEITLNITFSNADGSITYGTSDEVLSNITWTQTTTGTYTYLASLWGDDDGNAPSDAGLSLLKRDDMDDTYKISNWLMGVDYVFTWNHETNEVVVSDQYSGYTDADYGDMYVVELNQYNSDTAEMPSSYYDPDTKTFHFYVIYYVSAGYFGYGEETFTLDSASAAKAHKALKANAKTMKKAKAKAMKRTYKFSSNKQSMKGCLKNASKALAF